MQINKALLAIAMGLAMAACRDTEEAEDESTAEPRGDADKAPESTREPQE